MKRRWLVLPIILATACGSEEATSGSARAPLQAHNGIRLNGVRLNGVRLNGVRLNGVRLNGVRLNGVRLNGSALGGTDEAGVAVFGEALAGATLEGQLADGSELPLRIDAAWPVEDLWHYQISTEAAGVWTSICETDLAGQPYPAVFARGVWNDEIGVPGGGAWSDPGHLFSLSCTNGAIAKCLQAGYKPWRLAEEAYPAHLLACVRMLRADYCGDGAPWTVDGRPIDAWDDAGVLLQSRPDWFFEAEWTPDGARCVLSTRVVFGNTRPACVNGRLSAQCGRLGFSGGAVLMNRFEVKKIATAASPSKL
jgi:hypothetical protein